MSDVPTKIRNRSLLIVEGKSKGKKYLLSSNRKVTIGRGKENDIILDDPKCSRNQAVINLTDEGAIISNLSAHSPLMIDGRTQRVFRLSNGSEISVGATRFQYAEADPRELLPINQPVTPIVPQMAPPPHLSHTPSNVGHPMAPSHNSTRDAGDGTKRPHRTQDQSGRIRFYVIVASVVAIFGYLFSSKKPPKKEDTLRTPSAQEQAIKTVEERNEAIRQEQVGKGKNTRQFQDAQTLYLQGFRAYQKGDYATAVQHFTATLNLYPDHQMAEIYRKKALQKEQELIQYYMIRGRQYRDQLKYDFCVSLLKNVMVMITDHQSPVFKEAYQMKTECELLSEGRY